METKEYSDFSITLSTFFLKRIGLWAAGNSEEERRRKITLCISILILIYANLLEARDIYFSSSDYNALLYACCNMLSVFLAFLKVAALLPHKHEFNALITCMRDNFWNVKYNKEEMEIFDNSKKKCNVFIFFVTFSAHCSIFSYIITPLMENRGKNESERVLPFNLWLDLPWAISPYYECLFCFQVCTLYHVAVCYFSLDNVLCILNIHVAGQFRILQNRISKLYDPEQHMVDRNGNIDLVHYTNQSYLTLQKCIQKHQNIIDFCMKLENVFKLIVLGQVLIFSFLMCLFGYQVLLPDSPIAKRCIFFFLLSGSSILLFMFTYSCHSIMEQSDNVGNAAYSAPWMHMPMTKVGKMLRYDLMLIILRSRKVCCLTANGFFIVSLETYTSIISTAASYFTLLQQTSDNTIDK